MKHTKIIAGQIMDKFKKIGIRTKLIGSIESEGISENDIDLVLLDYSTIDNTLISTLQAQFSIIKYTITDWGGILIETADCRIDLFPNSFMKKCYYCKKKCCLTEGK